MIQNSKGKIWYGLHFYPGLAEYSEAGKDSFRVFLNEDTLRQMDPTFSGRPVFVMHVDGVDQDLNELRKDADGWVVESFFNAPDGKHWVKFITVSERAEKAIAQGMRLSNCYFPKGYGPGGLWNGVSYDKEITSGEYEHLALVPNPRYAESEVMTPEQFKAYNEQKLVELKRLANEGDGMKLNIFKRTKVENAVDLEAMSVLLPKSGREVTLTVLVNEADEAAVKAKEPAVADLKAIVNVGDSKMTVGDMVDKHKSMCDELDAFRKKNVSEDEEMENADDDGDEDDKKKKKENDDKDDADKKENAADEDEGAKAAKAVEATKKAAAKAKADAVRNAHTKEVEEPASVNFPGDSVARGKTRYGS